MHDADSALHVVDRVATPSTPRGCRRHKRHCRPGIHRDRAVAQTREALVESGHAGQRGRGDDDIHADVTREVVVCGIDGGVDEPLSGACELEYSEHRCEVFRFEHVGSVTLEQQAPVDRLGVGVAGRCGRHPLAAARVPRLARGNTPERSANLGEESIFLRPVAGDDDDLAGDAVVSGVVEPLGHHMFGLVPQVPTGPCARNDDDRRHPAELARDRLREQGSARGAAAVGIRPPHDCVVGVAASGDVNMVDLWMLR